MSPKRKPKVLKRVPGRPIVVNFEIVPGPPTQEKAKADPNGYYKVLGLDPSKDWTSEEVKKAYWVLAKKYHPDGSSPDPDEFRRVQVAYAVLKDEDSREKYDSLDPSQQWLDEDIIAAIIKNVVGLKNRAEAIEALREGLAREAPEPEAKGKVVGVVPPGPKFDSFSYYYYEGEDVPPGPVREQWVDATIRAMWDRGSGGEVKVGFTTGKPHVLSKQWGNVLMVSGNPSVEAATKLLDLGLVQPT